MRDKVDHAYKYFMSLPIERAVAVTMSVMAFAITITPDRGVAGFISDYFNSSPYDFALLLAMSGLFMFSYYQNEKIVFVMTIPLWIYMFLSIPYVFSVNTAPPVLPIICCSYLYLVNRVYIYHRLNGFYK